MSAIGNLILAGFDGNLSVLKTDAEMSFSVPEDQTFSAVILQTTGDIRLTVNLLGANSVCDIRAVYLAGLNNRLNLITDVLHSGAHSISNQKIKGILTDAAQMDFRGIIRIPRHSQKCAGDQNHRALLLSDRALVRATPELEIYADDVKCAHGSAIAALDEKQLFYLMSRGLSKIEARRLLIRGFVMDLMPAQWTDYIEQWMAEHV